MAEDTVQISEEIFVLSFHAFMKRLKGIKVGNIQNVKMSKMYQLGFEGELGLTKGLNRGDKLYL